MNDDCINLKERYADHFKIGFEQEREKRGDPWVMFVRCERGRILPWGDNLLAVEVIRRPVTRNRLDALGLHCVQDGDDEAVFLFDVSGFDEVAEIVKPRRKRRQSAEQRRESTERLKQYQFKRRTSERSQRASSHRTESTRG